VASTGPRAGRGLDSARAPWSTWRRDSCALTGGTTGAGRPDLGSWLAAYGRAWEGRDPVAVASLFTDDASYAITPSPFDEPLRGREEILDYWAGATAADKRVSFDYEVLAVADERGIARWWASMQERDGHVRIGGVFVVALTSDNRCSELREWWNGDDEERSGPPRLDVSPATRRPR
jgi:SnoaL-like domain